MGGPREKKPALRQSAAGSKKGLSGEESGEDSEREWCHKSGFVRRSEKKRREEYQGGGTRRNNLPLFNS